MTYLAKNSFDLLNWYKSIGIKFNTQRIPRNRLGNKSNKLNLLKKLREEIGNLENIELKENANNLVFSDGNIDSNIIVIGEAPGFEEDKSGLPFVGKAGKKLDEMLNSISLDRKKNVYITNIVPWRPKDNRTPNDKEINFFLPYIEKHISIINPKIVLLFGNVASKALLKRSDGITNFHGQWFDYKNQYLKEKIHAISIFHPSFLLRSPNKKKIAWEDLKKVKKKIVELKIL